MNNTNELRGTIAFEVFQENPNAWGYHLVIDARGCNDSCKSGDALTTWVHELVELIDMVAYGKPMVEHFAKHDPLKAGYTVIQMIETSAITGHFVDLNGGAYIDIFSCKPFDVQKVLDHLLKYFEPKDVFVGASYRGVFTDDSYGATA
jgi:S-adenosylmethionine/arginine decarboxylase-like enzyme